jgi:hypothetical protein
MVVRAVVSEKERERRTKQRAESLAQPRHHFRARTREDEEGAYGSEKERRAGPPEVSVAQSGERVGIGKTEDDEDSDFEISENEQQRRARQRAMSLREFCRRYSLGRTRAYAEIRLGRLRGRKIGRHVVIATDDAEAWFQNLPLMEVLP